MARPRLLVVEDDFEIQEVMKQYLSDHGFDVVVVPDGPQALERARDDIELVILDLGLPTMDGLDVVQRLRSTSTVPILIVSARGEGVDRVTGLELGADDYLVKPFLPRELVARVRALLRRSRLPASGSVASGPVQIDPVARRVLLEGAPVELTPLEFELLRILAQSPGRTWSREELLDQVWGEAYVGDTRRVDIHISKLRAKLTVADRPVPIRSVWGVGYRFEA
ncbi:MAG TPA: response regulator transcription factor [Candidatus Xenobia bacterium]